MQAVIIFLIIIAVLLVIFTLQNTAEVTVNVFFWEINNVPIILVIIGSIIVGYLVSAIYYYLYVRKLRREISQLKDSYPQEEDFDFEVKTKSKEKEDKDLHVEGYLMDED